MRTALSSPVRRELLQPDLVVVQQPLLRIIYEHRRSAMRCLFVISTSGLCVAPTPTAGNAPNRLHHSRIQSANT